MIWDNVQLTPDKEGYTTQECKDCNRKFKVAFGKGSSNKHVTYCPYCGWGDGQFWTCEQMTYLDCMAMNKIKKPNAPCQEPDENLPTLPKNKVTTKCKNTSESHSEPIKHNGTLPKYCIICRDAV